MATDSILRNPGFSIIDIANQHLDPSIVRSIESTKVEVTDDWPSQRIFVFFGLQAFLNTLAISLVGLSLGGFMVGNAEIGLWALGPALAGIVGATGIQVRTLKRYIDHIHRRQTT